MVCQNMNILLGVTRRLAVGLSNVAGWGCFVMEDIKEGEYIVRNPLLLILYPQGYCPSFTGITEFIVPFSASPTSR